MREQYREQYPRPRVSPSWPPSSYRSRRPLVLLGFCLENILLCSFRRLSVCETPICVLQLLFAIKIASSTLLLVFSIRLQEIAFLARSTAFGTVDNQRSSGVVIARGSICSGRSLGSSTSCSPQSTYQYLSEDRATFTSVGIRASVAR